MLRTFFLSLLLLCSLAHAQGDPWQALKQAYDASHNLNYQGVLQAQHLKDVKSMEITHAKYGDETYTRINLLDGEPNEILTKGKSTIVYGSTDDNVVIQKRDANHLFPAILPNSTEQLKQVYQLNFGKVDRVADRKAQIVVLMPNDDYRFFYHFWLDKQTSIPLKMIVSDHNNQVVEQTSFTKVKILEKTDLAWFKPNIDLSKKYVMKEEESIPSNLPRYWEIKQIPKGFKEVSSKVSRIGGPNILNHHMVFSDGLAYISLFIQPLSKGQKPKVGNATMGVTNVSARYENGYQIMAVGSVPIKTVETFSNAVNFN